MRCLGSLCFLDSNLNHLGHRHSKKLYAWETGPVDDMAMLLLCGEADFKVDLVSMFFFLSFSTHQLSNS